MNFFYSTSIRALLLASIFIFALENFNEAFGSPARQNYCRRIGVNVPIDTMCQMISSTRNLSPSADDIIAEFRDRFHEVTLLERVRRRSMELAEASLLQAKSIEACFVDRPIPGNEFSQLLHTDPNTSEEARQLVINMREDCEWFRETAIAQTVHAREYRRALALSEPALRDDRESPAFGEALKLNRRISPLYTRFSWNLLPYSPQPYEPLTNDEAREAEAEYNRAWWEAYDRRPSLNSRRPSISLPVREIAPGVRNPRDAARNLTGEDNSFIRREIRAFRARQRVRAITLLQENPLLGHVRSADGSDATIAEAARRARQRASEFGEWLRDLTSSIRTIRSSWTGSPALDLLLLEDAVVHVVERNPALCRAADDLTGYWDQVSAFKDGLYIGGTLAAGFACYLVTRSPVPCFGYIGTITGAVNFIEVRERYHFQLAALESAVNREDSVVRLIDQLDAGERQAIMAAILVPLPLEIIPGKMLALLERIPHFSRAVDRLSGMLREPAERVAERLLTAMRNVDRREIQRRTIERLRSMRTRTDHSPAPGQNIQTDTIPPPELFPSAYH